MIDPMIAPAKEPEPMHELWVEAATGPAAAPVGWMLVVGVTRGLTTVGAATGVAVATIGTVAIVGTWRTTRLTSTPAPGIYW